MAEIKEVFFNERPMAVRITFFDSEDLRIARSVAVEIKKTWSIWKSVNGGEFNVKSRILNIDWHMDYVTWQRLRGAMNLMSGYTSVDVMEESIDDPG